MFKIDAVDPEEELRAAEIAQRRLGVTADRRQRLLVDAPAQLHDIDLLDVVEQHRGFEERSHHVEMRAELALDRLGERIDRRSRSHDDRIVVVEQFDRLPGDALLLLAVDIALHVDVGIRHVGIGRTGAAVYLVQQPLRFQYLDVLADRHLRHAQFVGHVGDAHEAVFVQMIENVFVSFGYAQHIRFVSILIA